MEQNQPQPHSLLQSIFLHLFPGALIGACYALLRPVVIQWHYPTIFALVLAVMLVLVPLELGYLLVMGRKQSGQFTLDGLLSYQKPISGWQYLLWVAVVFIATGAIFTLMTPVQNFLQWRVFPGIPVPDAGLDGQFSRTTLLVTYSLFLIFVVVLGPLVEEYYFRGYLLPRVKGKYAPLLHSFLFALYHFFTPWLILTRTIGLLPLIYVVRKKNLTIGIIVHILLNSLDLIPAILLIIRMR